MYRPNIFYLIYQFPVISFHRSNVINIKILFTIKCTLLLNT